MYVFFYVQSNLIPPISLLLLTCVSQYAYLLSFTAGYGRQLRDKCKRITVSEEETDEELKKREERGEREDICKFASGECCHGNRYTSGYV